MRIHLKLSNNKTTLPFNYQPYLVGAFHKWLGKNAEHGELSLYSFSWLSNGKIQKNGFEFPDGTNWFISAHDETLIKKIIIGIQNDPEIKFGLTVKEILLNETPNFTNAERFKVASPVFIKRNTSEGIKFYFYNDADSPKLLTETLKHKLEKAGIENSNVEVTFDKLYPNPTTKKSNYNGIDNKGSVCPIIITGSQEQITFAWNVGVGNSTGIGFGALC